MKLSVSAVRPSEMRTPPIQPHEAAILIFERPLTITSVITIM